MEKDLSIDSRLGYEIIGAAFEVRKELGRWLNEAAYEHAMQIELAERGIKSKCQVEYPVIYKGHKLAQSFRVDMLVEDCVCLEFKALAMMTGRELSQIISYLNFCNLPLGYLINFRAEYFTPEKVPSKTFYSDELYLDKGIYRVIHKITYPTDPQ
ncbi:MAG: GxxExxY protein [Muribaculaceae bacterium]